MFPSDTSPTNADRVIDAKLHTMTGYWDFAALKPWRWVRSDPPAAFTALPPHLNSITGGGLVQGSTAVTLAAVVPVGLGSMAGRKFFMDSEGIPVRISTHVAGTAALVLQAGYPGIETSGSCTLFQDEYTVAPDILAFPVITEQHTGDQVTVLPEKEMKQRFPRNINGTTRAQYASFITQSKVRIVPWTTNYRLFECTYNQRPAALTFDGNVATDTPVCPQNARELIGLFALRRVMTDKRDQRIQVIQAEIQERLSILTSAELSLNPPRVFVPRGFRVSR